MWPLAGSNGSRVSQTGEDDSSFPGAGATGREPDPPEQLGAGMGFRVTSSDGTKLAEGGSFLRSCQTWVRSLQSSVPPGSDHWSLGAGCGQGQRSQSAEVPAWGLRAYGRALLGDLGSAPGRKPRWPGGQLVRGW